MSVQYIDAIKLPTELDEADYVLDFVGPDHPKANPKMRMTSYADNVYPFGVFGPRVSGEIKFAPITIFCGGNGSGKSTLLHVLAEKMSLSSASPFNKTPHFDEYVSKCGVRLAYGRKVPDSSSIIVSDDVFDRMLSRRRRNDDIDVRRQELSDEYFALRKEETVLLKSLDGKDVARFERKNAANRKTPSRFIADLLGPLEVSGGSNGQEAIDYFVSHITDGALHLLDEPENSLSPRRQLELLSFIEESVRFYDCQFVIATHSPFLLSLRGALIYDLDESPICTKRYRDLDCVNVYREFFETH